MAALDPELDVAVAAMVGENARFVVIGGFAVVAHRFVRATEDIDFLVPDDDDNDRLVLAALERLHGVRYRDEEPLRDEHLLGMAHLRAKTDAGIIDIMRGGLPPLDYETVDSQAIRADYGRGVTGRWASQHRRLQAAERPSARPERPHRARGDPWRAPDRADPGARYLTSV